VLRKRKAILDRCRDLATFLASGDWLREHRARPFWLLLGWLLVLLVVYLSLTPAPITLPIREGDKFSHAFAYFVLMSWFANLYSSASVRAAFATGFTSLGVILEFVQLWTGYRSFEVTDMAASAFGAVVGWVAAPPRLPNYLSLAERLLAHAITRARGQL